MRQWLEKLKQGLYRFMQGRYGQDALSMTTFVVSLLLVLCASIFSVSWLSAVALVLLVLMMLRTYSRNILKRRKENDTFLKLVAPIRQFFQMLGKRWKDRKTHRYFRCPKCGQYLRVPKGKGRIMITCKGCGERFERKS